MWSVVVGTGQQSSGCGGVEACEPTGERAMVMPWRDDSRHPSQLSEERRIHHGALQHYANLSRLCPSHWPIDLLCPCDPYMFKF